MQDSFAPFAVLMFLVLGLALMAINDQVRTAMLHGTGLGVLVGAVILGVYALAVSDAD